MKDIRESFALPVYVHIMSANSIYIHIEPTPSKLYKLIPVRETLVITRPPRQYEKEIGVKVGRLALSIVFFHSENDK